MSEAIYWAALDNIRAAVTTLDWPAGSLMYLERLPLAWLDDAAREEGLRFDEFAPDTPFDEWERGRVFSPDAELRWEKMDGKFRAVYAGENPPAGFTREETIDLTELNKRSQGYYLWGARVKEDVLAQMELPTNADIFVELQIPRRLQYPVAPDTQRVKLQVREYVEPHSGALVYYRFMRLEEEK